MALLESLESEMYTQPLLLRAVLESYQRVSEGDDDSVFYQRLLMEHHSNVSGE